jgi:Secretion system C-terminal sorting domain
MLVFNRTDGKEANYKEGTPGNPVEANALIYPNPVSGKSFNLILDNLEIEEYTINIYTATGKLIASRSLNYEGTRSNGYSIKLPAYIVAGNYTVQVVNSGGKIVRSVPMIVSK